MVSRASARPPLGRALPGVLARLPPVVFRRRGRAAAGLRDLPPDAGPASAGAAPGPRAPQRSRRWGGRRGALPQPVPAPAVDSRLHAERVAQGRRDRPGRNYDFAPRLCDGVVLASAWSGTRTVALTDCLVGVLDGMNEHGLAGALAFGGSQAMGEGFATTILLRAILESCATVEEATALALRVPVHMAYTVTLVDRSGAHATLFLRPDRPGVATDHLVAANHQETIEWPAYARFSATLERQRHVEDILAAEALDLEDFISRFLEPAAPPPSLLPRLRHPLHRHLPPGRGHPGAALARRAAPPPPRRPRGGSPRGPLRSAGLRSPNRAPRAASTSGSDQKGRVSASGPSRRTREWPFNAATGPEGCSGESPRARGSRGQRIFVTADPRDRS